MERLSPEKIEARLKENGNWKLVDEKWIMRKYRFRDYLKGIDFVNKVAQASEKAQHHPFISVDYKLVTLKISSWKDRGLTVLDFEMADQYDRFYEELTKES